MGKKSRLSLGINLSCFSLFLSLLICIASAAQESSSSTISSKNENSTPTSSTTTTVYSSSSSSTTTTPSSSTPAAVTTRKTIASTTTKRRRTPTTTAAATSTYTTTTTTPISTTTTAKIAASVIPQASQSKLTSVQEPHTLPEFIIDMMKKYGPLKAAEAFQSLDTLPLGLIMKILLVEVDKQLASDIVQMQRYAQSTDKELIQMIGKIVAGDKNVPQEIFLMDGKLMRFPWWNRIRQRMFNNLEKYVAAYSLVPVATKTAINNGVAAPTRSKTKSFTNNGLESIIEGPRSDLTVAVAASATESYSKLKNIQQQQTHSSSAAGGSGLIDNSAAASAPAPAAATQKLSLKNPLIQQQQIFDSIAGGGGVNNAQVQQLLQLQQLQQQQQLLQLQQQQQQQQQQATRNNNPFNPFLQLFG